MSLSDPNILDSEMPNEDIKVALMVAKNSWRYKNFTYFDKPQDKPVPFKELMKDEDIDVVQVHLLQTYGDEGHKNIVGFSGMFEWRNNTLKSLDADTYDSECLVYGYSWFTTKDNKRGLDILVEEM